MEAHTFLLVGSKRSVNIYRIISSFHKGQSIEMHLSIVVYNSFECARRVSLRSVKWGPVDRYPEFAISATAIGIRENEWVHWWRTEPAKPRPASNLSDTGQSHECK